MDGTDATTILRELDHRCTGNIDVWLRWRQCDDLVLVEVADDSTGDRFVVQVGDGEHPLDVFRHPYAYAAVRGVETRSDASE
jgi:hypothetical protein